MDITKPIINEKKVPTVVTQLLPPGEVLTYDYVLCISINEAEPGLLLSATPAQLVFALDSILLKTNGDEVAQADLLYHMKSGTYKYIVETKLGQKYAVPTVPTPDEKELYRILVEVLKLVTDIDYTNLNEQVED